MKKGKREEDKISKLEIRTNRERSPKRVRELRQATEKKMNNALAIKTRKSLRFMLKKSIPWTVVVMSHAMREMRGMPKKK